MTTLVDAGTNPTATIVELRRLYEVHSLDPQTIGTKYTINGLQFVVADVVAGDFDPDTAATNFAAHEDLDSLSEVIGQLQALVLVPPVSGPTAGKFLSNDGTDIAWDNLPADVDTAATVSYVNTTSGLTATDVQAALDELTARIVALETP